MCTVRCFNAAAAGPFGGCFAVQQTDTAASDNSANTIDTAQTLDGVLQQVNQNQKDLTKAIKGNNDAAVVDEQGVSIADELLGVDSTASATVDVGAAATSAAAAPAKGNAGNKNGGNAGAKNGGNAGAGNGGAKNGGNAAAGGNGNGKNNNNNNNRRSLHRAARSFNA